jgi:hypothetical protein
MVRSLIFSEEFKNIAERVVYKYLAMARRAVELMQ